MTRSEITLEEFCERLIEAREGDVPDALHDFFQLIGQKDHDACHIGHIHAPDEVEAELKRAAEAYLGSVR
jgi:hypothetical protein